MQLLCMAIAVSIYKWQSKQTSGLPYRLKMHCGTVADVLQVHPTGVWTLRLSNTHCGTVTDCPASSSNKCMNVKAI